MCSKVGWYREDACQSSLRNHGLPREDEPLQACENVGIHNPHTNKSNALYSTEATFFSACICLLSLRSPAIWVLTSAMMWRPSYSPGFVLGKTILIWSKHCPLICCWGWESQSPGKAQGTALREAQEKLTFQSKGLVGEVAENCQGCFTMRHAL